MALAEKGDSRKVNVQCGDLRGADVQDMYSTMPADGMVFAYGKGMDNDIGEYDTRTLGLCCLMTPGLSKDFRCHV